VGDIWPTGNRVYILVERDVVPIGSSSGAWAKARAKDMLVARWDVSPAARITEAVPVLQARRWRGAAGFGTRLELALRCLGAPVKTARGSQSIEA
jgi:hypothetical protein